MVVFEAATTSTRPICIDFNQAPLCFAQVVLVGDATVGKTHLLSRYVKGTRHSRPLKRCKAYFYALKCYMNGETGSFSIKSYVE